MLDEKKILSDAAADAILDAARAKAAQLDIHVSIAIVDDSGVLLRFFRPNAVHLGTVEVAVAKARSAALFRRPGKDLGAQLADGAIILTALPNLLPIDGGEPLTTLGLSLGGIGVSGSSPANDGAVARAGNAILQN